MKKHLLLILFIPIFSYTFSQEFYTLKRIVLDSKNKDRISYASIGVKEKSIGTYADANGYFEFHFPSEFLEDTLYISALGYSVYKVKLSDAIKDPSDFILINSHPILLKETLILSKKDSAGIILKKAVSNIKKNYSNTPYNVEAYYSEFIQEDQSFVRAIEAALDMYYDGIKYPVFSFKSSFQTKIKEERKSEDYIKNPDKFNNGNNMNLALKFCSIYFFTSYLKYSHFRIDSITYLNGELVYKIISLDGSEYFIIGQNNYAIYKIYDKISFPATDSNYKYVSFKVDKSHILTINKIIMSVDFFRYQNSLYPKLIETIYETTNFDKEMKTKETSITRFTRILFNKIIINEVKEIPKSEQIDINKDMFNIDSKYNKEFWDKYNIITDSSISEKVYHEIFK